MWSFASLRLLTLAAVSSRGLAALTCAPYMPSDIYWSYNYAVGYLTADAQDYRPRNDPSELSVGQDSPFALRGSLPWPSTDQFTLFNCSLPELGVKSRWKDQCFPASNTSNPTNTTTHTDFLQIVSRNSTCLTVKNATALVTQLNYTDCSKQPTDLRQLFPVTYTLPYPQGTCGGDPTDPLGGQAVRLGWQKKAYNPYTSSHWHLKDYSDPYSPITLTKQSVANERWVFMQFNG